MRFFLGGPRIFGLRTGLIFSHRDLWNQRSGAKEISDFVYVIRRSDGAVKVGMTNNPPQRLRNLQTGSPNRLSFAYVAGCAGVAARIESEAHKLMDAYAIQGDWFEASPEVAVAAVNAAAARLDFSLIVSDPALAERRVPVMPFKIFGPAERARGRRNMVITAIALVAGAIAGVSMLYLMLSTKAVAASHSDEIKTYANAMSIAVFASDRCPEIEANGEMLSALRIGMHIVDDDTPAITDIERSAGQDYRKALSAAPDLSTWCKSTYSLFGKNGSVVPGLLR